MSYKKWVRGIVILFSVGVVFNANAHGAYRPAKEISCSLNTDCIFSSYNDTIIITAPEKADYKCHITQKNNLNRDGEVVKNTITAYKMEREILGNGYRPQVIELGGQVGNEANVYFPFQMMSENEQLKFTVETKHDNYFFWGGGGIYRIADITINCVKI